MRRTTPSNYIRATTHALYDPPPQWPRQLATGLLVIGLAACSPDAPQKTQKPTALTASVSFVHRHELTPEVRIVGQLVPREMVRVQPQVDGLIVQKVLVEAGQHVRAGQPLLALDVTTTKLQQQQAAAERQRAWADVERMRRELEKMRAVADIGGISRNTIESNTLQLKAAEATAHAADAAEALASTRLQQAAFRAPFDALVLQRNVEVGDRTGASETPYFVLAKDGGVEFEAFASLRQLDQIKPGMAARILVDGQVPAAGQVKSAAVAVDGQTRSGRVRVTADASALGASGAPASILITLPSRQAVAVPVDALRFDPTPWVWKVDERNVVRRQDVELGVANGDHYEVIRGLKEGDRVVGDSGALLVEGDQITAVDPRSPVAAPSARKPK